MLQVQFNAEVNAEIMQRLIQSCIQCVKCSSSEWK